MRNLILQHFDGELRDLDRLSINNMKEYAKLVDADYSLVRGKPFRSNLTGACQKVFMLDEMYDEYKDVLMVDIDMFAPRHMSTNIFKEKFVTYFIKYLTVMNEKIKENVIAINSK